MCIPNAATAAAAAAAASNLFDSSRWPAAAFPSTSAAAAAAASLAAFAHPSNQYLLAALGLQNAQQLANSLDGNLSAILPYLQFQAQQALVAHQLAAVHQASALHQHLGAALASSFLPQQQQQQQQQRQQQQQIPQQWLSPPPSTASVQEPTPSPVLTTSDEQQQRTSPPPDAWSTSSDADACSASNTPLFSDSSLLLDVNIIFDFLIRERRDLSEKESLAVAVLAGMAGVGRT